MLRLHEIKLKLGEDVSSVPVHIKKMLGLSGLEITEWRLVKESVDARDKKDILMVYSADFSVKATEGQRSETEEAEKAVLDAGAARKLKIAESPDSVYHYVTEGIGILPGGSEDGRPVLSTPPVVVGFGPCGMFVALLLAQMGYRPVVLERGKAIEERVGDVERFFQEGILDPESNVQFGEGGAGSFSDGKLTTQIKDKRIRKVLSELAQAGGGEEILYKQKPHVGTDVLRQVVKAIRQEIIRLGGTVRFGSRVTGLVFADGQDAGGGEKPRRLTGLEINGEQVLETEVAVLALGHSARDTFRTLYSQGLEMEQKPFSMGVRIEHPQNMINETQYGKEYSKYGLGAADYKLSWRCGNGRGVYTFCMCPGGQVIASASQEGGVVTNGMSLHSRDLENANSGLLVDVRTEDFEDGHPLAGVAFQEKYERLAFEAGGGGYSAPAQRVGDFLTGRPSAPMKRQKPGTVNPSYEPGVTWTSLDQCLPDFVTEALREALPCLGRKLRGFDRPDAVMTGVETRSSSPVRILRGEELTCNVEGVYPGGEGAGYAGGITSSAVDGIRIAEAIALKYRPVAGA